MTKRTILFVALILAVAVGSALSPALLDLPAAAQEILSNSPSISSYIGANLTPLHVIDEGSNPVTALAFSPDDQLLASGYSDGEVIVWQASDGSQHSVLEGHAKSVRALAFSPDGAQLVSGSDDSSIQIWDLQDGGLIHTQRTTLAGRVLNLVYSPDGSQIAVGGHNCNVELRLASTGLRTRTLALPQCGIRRGGSAAYIGMAFNADGTQLFIGVGESKGGNGSIWLWDVSRYSSPEQIRRLELGVRDLAVSADGESLGVALVGSSYVRLFDPEDGTLIYNFQGHQHRVNSVAFSPDDRLLASASRDGTVRIWGTGNGFLLRLLEDHEGSVNSVTFSPDGSMLASGGDDGAIIVWGLASP